ncbi:MAG TPA: hypothetical protein VKB80_18630 [Kofleriaceae bacterium]|nr:hypothetical protein [Kofleriaceae bacterium]
MKRTILALLVAGLLGGAVFGTSGCYATSVGVGVEAGTPAPYYSDYYYRPGYVFIDGRWGWAGTGWEWYPGYWVAARPGFVYVQGYWDYWGGHYYWRPGLWSRYHNGYAWIGGRWRVYNRGYRHFDYRHNTWVGYRGYRGYRDHRGGRGYRAPVYRGRSGDHRSYRDHRSNRRR